MACKYCDTMDAGLNGKELIYLFDNYYPLVGTNIKFNLYSYIGDKKRNEMPVELDVGNETIIRKVIKINYCPVCGEDLRKGNNDNEI